MSKNRPVETDRATRDVATQVSLKSPVGKTRTDKFVFAEQDEKKSCGHAHDGNGLREVRGPTD